MKAPRADDAARLSSRLSVALVAAVLGVIVYYSLRIDWEKVIGKWAPWALRDDGDNGEKKP